MISSLITVYLCNAMLYLLSGYSFLAYILVMLLCILRDAGMSLVYSRCAVPVARNDL